MSKKILVFITILTLIVSLNALSFYHYEFDSYRRNEPYYPLGFINNGTTIMLNFTTPGTTFDFSGNFNWIISTDYLSNSATVACNEVTGCNAGQNFCTVKCPIIASNFYKIDLRKNNFPALDDGTYPSALQFFYVTVSQYDTNFGGYSNSSAQIRIRYKATQTFRRRLTKLIYNEIKQNLTFSLYPVKPNGASNPQLGRASLYLWKVINIQDANSVYDINGQPELLTDTGIFARSYDPVAFNMTYTSNAPLDAGYYVFMMMYKNSNNAPLARVSYTSDQYVCPYSPDFADYNQNFQPCLGNQTSGSNTQSPGFPCVNFDNSSLTCLGCFTGYELVSGSCVFNDTCPDRFYFHFGVCYPVSESCLTYERFTGACLSCVSNSSSLINGSCVQPTVTCGTRQVVINNLCVDVSVLCNNFDSTTGLCTSCINGFDLQSDGSCTPIVLNCPSTQYIQNGVCVDIPANCASFDQTLLRCSICNRGYWPSNLFVCQKTICSQRKVPSAFGAFCVDVSPLCGEYDDLTGDCLTCRLEDHTVVNGDCRGVSSPLAGCEERERLGFGECVNAQVNCERYNLQTGNCETCLSSWFKDYTGRCTLSNTSCQADEVIVQGICMQRPPNCLTLNSFGMCSQCISDYILQDGQCFFRRVCGNNQYQTSTGVCVDIVSACSFYNPTTGVCLQCSDGREAINGLCCPIGQHAYQRNCIDQLTYRNIVLGSDQSQTPICIGYHPTMGYCVVCNGNFVPSAINPQICI